MRKDGEKVSCRTKRKKSESERRKKRRKQVEEGRGGGGRGMFFQESRGFREMTGKPSFERCRREEGKEVKEVLEVLED